MGSLYLQVQKIHCNPGLPHQKVADLNAVTLASPKLDLRAGKRRKAAAEDREWLQQAKDGVNKVLLGRSDESWSFQAANPINLLLTGAQAAQRLLGSGKTAEASSRQCSNPLEATDTQTEDSKAASGPCFPHPRICSADLLHGCLQNMSRTLHACALKSLSLISCSPPFVARLSC